MLKPFCLAGRRILRRPSWRGGVVRQVRQAVRRHDGRRLPTALSFGTTEPGERPCQVARPLASRDWKPSGRNPHRHLALE
jgi:hypothetical protein